jgi:hypothetical protein
MNTVSLVRPRNEAERNVLHDPGAAYPLVL